MPEPTNPILAAALDTALNSFQANPSWDLMRALAEATTTAQSKGVEGFKVFRDIRKCVAEQVHPLPLTDFNDTAPRNKVVAVLTECRKKVSGD